MCWNSIRFLESFHGVLRRKSKNIQILFSLSEEHYFLNFLLIFLSFVEKLEILCSALLFSDITFYGNCFYAKSWLESSLDIPTCCLAFISARLFPALVCTRSTLYLLIWWPVSDASFGTIFFFFFFRILENSLYHIKKKNAESMQLKFMVPYILLTFFFSTWAKTSLGLRLLSRVDVQTKHIQLQMLSLIRSTKAFTFLCTQQEESIDPLCGSCRNRSYSLRIKSWGIDGSSADRIRP